MESTPRKFRKSMLFFSKMLLFALLLLVFTLVWWYDYPEATFWRSGNILVVFFYAAILIAFSALYGATKIGILRIGEVIYSFVLTLIITNVIAYAQFSLIARGLVNPIGLLVTTAIQAIIAAIGAQRINRLYFRLYPAREVIVVYSSRAQARRVIEKMSQKVDRYRVCAAVSETEGYDAIKEMIDQYASVLFCDIDRNLQNRLFLYCSLEGKRVYLLPDFQDVLVRNAHQTQIFDTPVFYSKNSAPSTEYLIFKRCVDIVFSVLALILTAPLMLLTALAIHFSDGGPALFVQNRITLNGRIFRLYKFRSMVVHAEKDGEARFSSVNDDRITPVGKIIRRLRIDELPQLINILKGDMSIVGPRPERPEIAIQYRDSLPEFTLRQRVKAGLTGYAQIYGRYNTTLQDKLLLDLLYIESCSPLMDFRLMFMTIKILFMPESTEGVSEGEYMPPDMEKESSPPPGQ